MGAAGLALATTGSLWAGDCRAVVQAGYGVTAYRATTYGHGYQAAAIIAVEPYYSVELVAPELRAKQRAKEQAEKIESLEETARQNTEAIKLLLQLQQGGGGGGGTLALTAGEDGKFWGVLRKHCLDCHKGDGAKGQQKFFEADGAAVKLTPLQILLIDSVTNDDSMPPSDKKLTPDEYKIVRSHYEKHRTEIRAAVKNGAAKE